MDFSQTPQFPCPGLLASANRILLPSLLGHRPPDRPPSRWFPALPARPPDPWPAPHPDAIMEGFPAPAPVSSFRLENGKKWTFPATVPMNFGKNLQMEMAGMPGPRPMSARSSRKRTGNSSTLANVRSAKEKAPSPARFARAPERLSAKIAVANERCPPMGRKNRPWPRRLLPLLLQHQSLPPRNPPILSGAIRSPFLQAPPEF